MLRDPTDMLAALSNENFDLRRKIAELEIRLGLRSIPERERTVRDGLQMSFDDRLEAQIMTPHDGEQRGDPPLWLVYWLDDDEAALGWPALRGIATSELDARILTGMVLEQSAGRNKEKAERISRGDPDGLADHHYRVEVERTAGNHLYGSRLLVDANSRVVFETKPIRIVRGENAAKSGRRLLDIMDDKPTAAPQDGGDDG